MIDQVVVRLVQRIEWYNGLIIFFVGYQHNGLAGSIQMLTCAQTAGTCGELVLVCEIAEGSAELVVRLGQSRRF